MGALLCFNFKDVKPALAFLYAQRESCTCLQSVSNVQLPRPIQSDEPVKEKDGSQKKRDSRANTPSPCSCFGKINLSFLPNALKTKHGILIAPTPLFKGYYLVGMGMEIQKQVPLPSFAEQNVILLRMVVVRIRL